METSAPTSCSRPSSRCWPRWLASTATARCGCCAIPTGRAGRAAGGRSGDAARRPRRRRRRPGPRPRPRRAAALPHRPPATPRPAVLRARRRRRAAHAGAVRGPRPAACHRPPRRGGPAPGPPRGRRRPGSRLRAVARLPWAQARSSCGRPPGGPTPTTGPPPTRSCSPPRSWPAIPTCSARCSAICAGCATSTTRSGRRRWRRCGASRRGSGAALSSSRRRRRASTRPGRATSRRPRSTRWRDRRRAAAGGRGPRRRRDHRRRRHDRRRARPRAHRRRPGRDLGAAALGPRRRWSTPSCPASRPTPRTTASTPRRASPPRSTAGLELPAWQSLADRARRAADDATVRTAVGLGLAPPATRPARVAAALATDPSTIVIRRVQDTVERSRTDLLDDLLRRPRRRRFLRGSGHHVPDFRPAPGRWPPRQLRAFATLLDKYIARDTARPAWQRPWAIRLRGPLLGVLDVLGRRRTGLGATDRRPSRSSRRDWRRSGTLIDPRVVVAVPSAHVDGYVLGAAVPVMCRCLDLWALCVRSRRHLRGCLPRRRSRPSGRHAAYGLSTYRRGGGGSSCSPARARPPSTRIVLGRPARRRRGPAAARTGSAPPSCGRSCDCGRGLLPSPTAVSWSRNAVRPRAPR